LCQGTYMPAPFDPAKAAVVNDLLQQGLTLESAIQQAGIAADDASQYQLDVLPGSGEVGKVIQRGSNTPFAGDTTADVPVTLNTTQGSQADIGGDIIATDPNLIIVPPPARIESTEPVGVGDAVNYGTAYGEPVVLPTVPQTALSDQQLRQIYPAPEPDPAGPVVTEAQALQQNAQNIVLDPQAEATRLLVAQASNPDTAIAVPADINTQLSDQDVSIFYTAPPLVPEAERVDQPVPSQDPFTRPTETVPPPAEVITQADNPFRPPAPPVEVTPVDSPANNDTDPLAQNQVPAEPAVRPTSTTVSSGIDPTVFLLGAATLIGPSVIPLPVRDGLALAGTNNARSQQVINTQRRATNSRDWRVKLKLGPNADYLYNAAQPGDLLFPLRSNGGTDGVIFPYTPSIQTTYATTYQKVPLTHSNHQGLFYKNSSAQVVQITATFTAQDTQEADYLLAVIHFLRSAGKMFYGQDANNGAPPPVLFLSGFGEFQFNNHPLVLENFTYNLPNKVDYIRARSSNDVNLNLLQRQNRGGSAYNGLSGVLTRLNTLVEVTQRVLKIKPGANPNIIPTVQNTFELGGNNPTYVPTEMEISITLIPIQSREQVSKQFSLTKFAQGNLQRGGFW